MQGAKDICYSFFATFQTDGGVREPLDEETQTSPHGSFTQVSFCKLLLSVTYFDFGDTISI